MSPALSERGGLAGSPVRMPGLDLVRFGAALMVALYHLAYLTGTPGTPAFDLANPAAVIPGVAGASPLGWVGVEIFFVLSRVVIASCAEGRSARAFLRGRFLRFYPAVWICATITAVVLFSIGRAEGLGGRYVRSLLLLPGPD